MRSAPSRRWNDPAAAHISRVLNLVDVDAIRRRRFQSSLDCNHGSGAVATPRLLEQLGCDVHVLGGVANATSSMCPNR